MRGKNCKRRPQRPVIIGPAWWIHGGDETPPPPNDALPLPMKVGGEFSLTRFSADMTPTTLATIRKRESFHSSPIPIPRTDHDT